MKLFAMESSYAESYLTKIENATIEERAAAANMFGEKSANEIMSIENGVAKIYVTGSLSPDGPSPLDRFFGFTGTAYSDIIDAANQAREDSSVQSTLLLMNTPGGTVAGMDGAFYALSELNKTKEITVENHGMIASAGYYLAMAGSKIKAVSPLAMTGSIGVIMAGIDSTEAMNRAGFKRIKIVSSNAPDKQPDISTDQGRATIQNEIDAIERVFLDTISSSRGVSVEYVKENFGKGGILIAKDPSGAPDALKVGMIDEVINSSDARGGDDFEAKEPKKEYNSIGFKKHGNEKNAEQKKEKGDYMDLNQLKAEFPAVYNAAVNIGVTQERERVEAHAEMGEASGDMELAMKCIKEGTEFSATVNAKYLAAGMKNQAISARADEAVPPVNAKTEIDEREAKEEELNKLVAAELGVNYDA